MDFLAEYGVKPKVFATGYLQQERGSCFLFLLQKTGRFDVITIFLQELSKFLHADWLVAIVYKSTDNKNDIRCNAHAFSMENMLLQKTN